MWSRRCRAPLEARIVLDIRPSDQLAEARPAGLREHQPEVQPSSTSNIGAWPGPRTSNLALVGPGRARVLLCGRDALEHRDVDVLALAAARVAVVEREQRTAEGGEAGEELRGPPADLERLAVVVPRDVERASEGERREVRRLPVAVRARSARSPRPRPRSRRGAPHPPPPRAPPRAPRSRAPRRRVAAGREVLDHDVGPAGEPLAERATGGLLRGPA